MQAGHPPGYPAGVRPPTRYRNHYEAYIAFALSNEVSKTAARKFYPALCYEKYGLIHDESMLQDMAYVSMSIPIEVKREVYKDKLVKNMRELREEPNLYASLNGAYDSANVVVLMQRTYPV